MGPVEYVALSSRQDIAIVNGMLVSSFPLSEFTKEMGRVHILNRSLLRFVQEQ